MSSKSFDSLLAFMKTVIPLGKDPPAITSLCFNHNGKILAAAAIDGMIHMFGILIFYQLSKIRIFGSLKKGTVLAIFVSLSKLHLCVVMVVCLILG